MLSSTSRTFGLCLFFIIFFVSQRSSFANQKSYIVYLGGHPHREEITKDDLKKVSESHVDFLETYLGTKEKANDAIFESYRRHINGFAATLDEKVADEIRANPKVISVFLNKENVIQTTHSWAFLSLEKEENLDPANSLWKNAKYGEDIIIGNIDTGVWPESKSFNDEGYGPIPSRWRGICEKGSDPTFSCNRKLIGARYYKKGYDVANLPKINASMVTPRDFNGHGTHTLSTAGGNFVPGIEMPGIGKIGTAKGGAPKARVAAYKSCWGIGFCFDSDVLKAIDHSIYDRVHVISISILSRFSDYSENGIAIGSMHAIKYNINVVTGAGNMGPKPSTVGNLAPWMLTVAASTIDRRFESAVELGNGVRLNGQSIISDKLPQDKLYPLVSGEQAQIPGLNSSSQLLASQCVNVKYIDPVKVKGKILICAGSSYDPRSIMYGASTLGIVGAIICNEEAKGAFVFTNWNFIPSSLLTYKDSLIILNYTKSTDNPMAIIRPPTLQLGIKPSPMLASFSSRGPNPVTPEILKPDVTAPGVEIVAATSEKASPSGLPYDKRTTSYGVMSGTSMACPHVSGVVAILRAIYPKWSTAAIQSAIMTTAKPIDNMGGPLLDLNSMDATPFAYGAGLLEPNRAADPGLIYDLHVKDYLNFLCISGYNTSEVIEIFYDKGYQCPPQNSDEFSHINLNYPSITVPKLAGTVVVKRTVTNVGPPHIYKAQVIEPKGISISLEPNVLQFQETGEKKSFTLTMKIKEGGSILPGNYVFGELVWSDGYRNVRSPITVAPASS